MALAHERARQDLREWRGMQPKNYVTSNRQLVRLMSGLMDERVLANHMNEIVRFGKVAAGPLEVAAALSNRPHNLPRLERWSPIGEREEAIEHHPAFHDCGRHIYEDGRVIAAYGSGQPNLLAQTLFYISSHAGEAGHNCPVACTAGVVKALGALGSDELKARYLPSLLDSRYSERLDGAQFLTEIQGGSDVGSNAVEARPDGQDLGTSRWRITGEKWFCSNADADLILMTARVHGAKMGTSGLGLFLVPRVLASGHVNDFTLRRLKDKLGTRSMPSGEIDFHGARAWALGAVDEGFRNVITHVINTSRLYNSTGCAGMTRRAHLIALAYARARRAFGRPIVEYPLVQQMLADTGTTSAALVAGCLHLARLFDDAEGGQLDDRGRAFVRVATNLVKIRSCQHSHRVINTAIETLGGNGTIEDFSPLPRMLRDNVVYENWEGTHNTLITQSVRDFQKHRLHEGFLSALRELVTPADATIAAAMGPASERLSRASRAIDQILRVDDSGLAAWQLRPHAEALADCIFAGAWARDITTETDPERRAVEIDGLAWFCQEHLGTAEAQRTRALSEATRRVALLEV